MKTKMKITQPTSIQRSALPTLLSIPSNPNDARDVFIQAQTGSGKTLSFLLPIIQDLLPLSSLSYIDRSVGTLAIIIAPTRELAKQISDVLETLLQLRLRQEDEFATSSARLTRWLVSGLLTGGATRTHEKSRLRKGVPILVSTPGRLLDHLQNTSSFNVAKCRWLVLDEADRLMDLGFEETITGILKALEGRRKLALKAVDEGSSMEVGGWDWKRRRRTILCSATIQENVQKLAGTTLLNPVRITATEIDKPSTATVDPLKDNKLHAAGTEKFTPPSQLVQKYVVVPLKLRLVALVASLRSLISAVPGNRGNKIIVFFSCTDSVDFHWNLLAGSSMDGDDDSESTQEPSDSDGERVEESGKVAVQSSLFPNTSIYRLHGSLPTAIRALSLRGFSEGKGSPKTQTSSILFCTSVASRGLDLPLVRAVVQYDLPTEGGATEYIHRVGRTARAGKGGEAWSFISPSETEWVKWVEDQMRGTEMKISSGDARSSGLSGLGIERILRTGFGGEGSDYENRATDVQLSFERWVLRNKEVRLFLFESCNADWYIQNTALARKAYMSSMRAYATHPSNEKHIFHIRHLHLGHLAKSFALRDTPTSATARAHKSKGEFKSKNLSAEKVRKPGNNDRQTGDTEERMQAVVREQGRLSKKKGIMMASGSREFQVADGYTLETLLQAAP